MTLLDPMAEKGGVRHILRLANLERSYQYQKWGLLPQHILYEQIEQEWVWGFLLFNKLIKNI